MKKQIININKKVRNNGLTISTNDDTINYNKGKHYVKN